jgi:hypothetical protein
MYQSMLYFYLTSQSAVFPLFLVATVRATRFIKLPDPEKCILLGALTEMLWFIASLACVDPKGASFSA